MTAIEKWNRIVEIHEQYYNAKEDKVQNVWEVVFSEILGYSSLNGEIERHRNIQIGSSNRIITGIIIKCNGQDLFVVELKQHNLSLEKGMERQLLSYLKQLRNNTGIIVCNEEPRPKGRGIWLNIQLITSSRCICL